MKRQNKPKNRIFKRVLSFTLALALVFTGMPIEMISEEIAEHTGIVMSVKAAEDPDTEALAELTAKYTETSYSFNSNDSRLAEYSQCFQDPEWASSHKNDTVTLLPASGGIFTFPADYSPIGNQSAPFEGLISLNTTADSFKIQLGTPLFNYVKDSVRLLRNDGQNIQLSIIRSADAGNSVSPLFAVHVDGSGAETPYEWKVSLNSASTRSHSGVIYEMYGGANINLTFNDESTHTPGKDANGNIVSGSIIVNNEDNTNYGILCGSITDKSKLTATYTYTDTTAVTFIGTGNANCGGLIGEINNSKFELLSSSDPVKVDFQTAKKHVGFICGHAEESIVTLPVGYTFSGTIDGTEYAGGIAGYCMNTVVNYETAEGTITLENCNIKNGTTTGGVFGYYECNDAENDILIKRSYALTKCTVTGTGISGGIAGEYKPAYTTALTIDLNNYSMDTTTKLNTGTSAGGLFGKFTAAGNVTIKDSDTTNTHFTPPSSTVPYGGVIGEYVNNNYANTLTLSGFTIDKLNCTSKGSVGGVIGTLNGSTYVSVSGVSITNVTASDATYFGGIISKLDDENAGSFIDVTGNFTLSMASGKTYKGGAIAGSFKKGVIRLAGTTDISGAKAANGYAQLVYENDETLVYAKGNGSDSAWTLKRNADTTASDLGQWGEVVRLFKVGDEYKNAEGAGIVSVADNKVTIAQGVTAITDTVSFAKCALNMQLNDGSDHGALCITSGSANKTALLASDITVTGEIDLSGTGLLGLMRDGGNGQTLSNVKEFFSGSVTGSDNAEIKLASGEAYGTYAEGSTGTGGKIYLTGNNGHDAQGLFAFAKNAEIKDLTVSGKINAECNSGSYSLYAGALFGAMSNGAKLSGVNISTTINTTRSSKETFYIGGVSGVFDGTGEGTLIIGSNSSIKPKIELYGSISCTDGYSYVGGVLGLLKGSTPYNVSIANTEISPTINIDDKTTSSNESDLGGMIGRVAKSSSAHTIEINTVTMTSASVDTKAKYSGGLLGGTWETTNLTVNGLVITGSIVDHKYSGTGSKQSGLVFRGTGKWDINSLSINNTSFNSTDAKPASFGLIVNEAYSGDDGLYINLKNSGYSLTGVTVPTDSSDANYYVDEIAADTKNNEKNDGDIMVGGTGTGVVNINMNTADGALTKIVDSETPVNGTGTYQNRLALGNLIGNQNSRYYYNLDVMMSEGHTKTDGEKFLLWSVNQYAASNIKTNFTSDIAGITDINLSGLSYYPINGGDVTLPANATVTFGFKEIRDYENTSISPDDWKRFPDDIGEPKSDTARNQHYLMQTGLFTTVSSLTANSLTLAGDFGYVEEIASGALINKSTSGSVTLTGLTLDGLKPSSADSYLLINYIDGTGTATPKLEVSNLRASNYNAAGITLPVAKSLFGKATGQNLTITFSDIKLDARDGSKIGDTSWTTAAATAMNEAYGTSRSIFSTATFFETLLASKISPMEYNYTVAEDWGDEKVTAPRNVTYGEEVTKSKQYAGGEERYNVTGNETGRNTNPISNSDTRFDFSSGFLPYVANYEDKGKDETYPVVEIKVNYKAPGITVGCGTYNDPYVISNAEQFETVADIINNGTAPSSIRLPNVNNADRIAASWCDDNDSIYTKNANNNNYTNSVGKNNYGWNLLRIRYYLASAYYLIDDDLELSTDFEGIGKPATANWEKNQTKGNFTFHGVIVGDSTSKPTITIPNGNPLIVVANGAVIKNVNINITAENITKTQASTGDLALYGYGISHSGTKKENAVYYGGVIGEIMGGDNIIDDVTVTYSGTTTLGGSAKHLIAEGGMVGCVVNGALIFRGSNEVVDRTVNGGGIYSNPIVGRVINGYAVFEKIEGRTGTAPDNYNTMETTGEGEEEQVTKTYTYPIDTIDRSNTNKLDVNYSAGTVTVPDAQALYIMSLITQSISGTANTSGNEEYDKYSPSYGFNSYITGIARLGDYTDVGCGSLELTADHKDYSDFAYLDSVNNYTNASAKEGLLKAPVPYIIYSYTTRYGTTANNPAADFPARKMTADNTKFWEIKLDKNDTFASMDSFQAFRGIGSVGVVTYNNNQDKTKTSMKVATFNGNGNTINLHISLPRYRRDIENYYHKQPESITQVYTGTDLGNGGTSYGQDGANIIRLMGLGLFDSVLVKNDGSHENQFENFTLQGKVEDKVFDSSGNDVTGNAYNTQLFCVGGVVGKRVNGNNSDLNFKDITFDGLTVTGAYNCGGLVGIDAVKNAQIMKIDGCGSTDNGISVTGGFFDDSTADNAFRNGIGGLVGFTFWCRPIINGKTDTEDVSEIKVDKVTSFYQGDDYGVNVGGLIGYTGTGAEIKNIKLTGANDGSVIGAPNALNAAGFIGFAQPKASGDDDDSLQAVTMENCTLYHLSVKAKRSAAGFYGRSWNSNWSVRYIDISNCAVIGEKGKHEIKAYGSLTDDVRDCSGGFISGCDGNSTRYSIIQNSYIEGYTIEGYNAGGIIGRTTNKPTYMKNLYVKDCDIISNNAGGSTGGIVGYSNQNLSGYNLKTDGVNYYLDNSGTKTDRTSNAGFIVGKNNDNTKTDKFIAIGAYYTNHPEKVPAKVVGINTPKNDSFFVFADYTNTSSALTAATGKPSTFGDANNSDQPYAPFVNVSPHMGMGTDEYLTGDGASVGKAGEIYKDTFGTSNRRYVIETNDNNAASKNDTSVGKVKDSVTLANYINADGKYKDDVFKISSASAVFGEEFDELDVDNFTMLVINDDSDKTNDITPFIKSYIRLVTNAAGSANNNTFNQYAYSCGNNTINQLYEVVINPCYYDATEKKFVLGTAGDQGLKMYDQSVSDNNKKGKYYFDSSKADSASGNLYQFSLIDVQFKDPTDTTKIAYHLYVPVYAKSMISVDFSAVSMSETEYSRDPYAEKIVSELNNNKSKDSPSLLVESTNEWTTTFVRFTYPKKEISGNEEWNYDKTLKLQIDTTNFKGLPAGTKLILLDPNANVDKYYRYDITAMSGSQMTLKLSDFKDEAGEPFTPQNLKDIYKDSGAQGTENGKEVIYEDYYISMYVPMTAGDTHSVTFGCSDEMSSSDSGYKANIASKLYSMVVLGDLFEHTITRFDVTSGDGSTYPDSPEMTAANNVLKTEVTAEVKIKNRNAGSYLAAGSNVYHSFFVTLTSHDENQKVTDIIYGIDPGYVRNETTYTYTNSTGEHSVTVTNATLESNYIQLYTGSLINALMDSTTTPTVTISSVTTMTFSDTTAFPYNPDKKDGIGTQVSIKSNLAYRKVDLNHSALNVYEGDSTYYYSTSRNGAELTFNAVPADDDTDEIGYKTNNRSLLGVNGKYGDKHPIIGKAIYNVDDIVDFESAEKIVYTIKLYKKVTDSEGHTTYQQVEDISKYLDKVKLADSKVDLTADTTDRKVYTYSGAFVPTDDQFNERMFDADFSCEVLTGDSAHNEYANYKIVLTAELIGLIGPKNSRKDAFLIYTNAKIDPSVIDETE